MVVSLGYDTTDVIEHALFRSLVHGVAQCGDNCGVILVADFDKLLECLGAVVDAYRHKEILDGAGVVAEHSAHRASAHIHVAVGRHHCHGIVHIFRC